MSLTLLGILMQTGFSAAGNLSDIPAVRGGLVVVVGCDGEFPVTGFQSRSVFQYLDSNPANVESMRARIRARGDYGRASAVVFDGRSLPYIDNSVNLLVIRSSAAQVSNEEMTRVLSPRGVLAVTRDAEIPNLPVEAYGRWNIYRKPVPDSIDSWPQFLYDASNNAISRDTTVGPPVSMQWRAGPPFTRHHNADKGTRPTIRAVIAASGRLYYMIDETNSSNLKTPSAWFLLARDAFNGIELWKVPVKSAEFAAKLENVRRSLVADEVDGGRVYATMSTGGPLSQIDGASGKTIRTYSGSENAVEVINDGQDVFVVNGEGSILGYRSESSEQRWRWNPGKDDAIYPLTTAAAGGRVFVKTDTSAVCLAADSGKILWQTALQAAQVRKRFKNPHERLLVADGVVLCSYAGTDGRLLYKDNREFTGLHPQVRPYDGKLAALSAETGEILWSGPYYPSLDDGSPGEIYVRNGRVLLGPDFSSALDLKTGERHQGSDIIEGLWTSGHHYRCYPGRAVANYILTAKRGVEFIDLVGSNHSRNNWVRGICRTGVTPANGLIYVPPHSCGCYMEAKLWGFWALSSERNGNAPGVAGRKVPDNERLMKGPAYGELAGTAAANTERHEWACYRGNASRSGSTATELAVELKTTWTADIGGKLSAATCGDGKVFVAQTDAHTVHALNAKNGTPVWQFVAGARVDSPPTFHNGLLLFGSRDGFVYCLRASDGTLAWKFLAAPCVRMAVAFEQPESLWPVHGSVLIENNTAYVSAGRSSYLDGGITLYGLDPASGEVRYRHVLKDEHVGYTKPPDNAPELVERIRQNWPDFKTAAASDKSDSFSMHGALPDIMSAENGSVFMRHLRFDDKLNPMDGRYPRLFSTSSLLDGYEFNRSYWILGTADFKRIPVAYSWLVKGGSLAVPYGLMLSFDASTVRGVRREKASGSHDVYSIFSVSRPDPKAATSALPDFEKRAGKETADQHAWKTPLPFRPRSMITCGRTLVTGGMARQGKGILRLTSARTGATLRDISIPASPVWDGMGSAGGSLVVPLTDGSVVCLGTP